MVYFHFTWYVCEDAMSTLQSQAWCESIREKKIERKKESEFVLVLNGKEERDKN